MEMDYSQYAYKIRQHIEEATKVKESYDTAKEGILEEYEVRKKVLQDVDERLKRNREAYKRGEVTKNLYSKMKKDHESAKKLFLEMKAKLDEIDQFMNARLDGVISKLEDLNGKYNKEIEKETKKLAYKLKKAKYDFLNSVIDVREEYLTLRNRELDLQEINKGFGPKSVLTSQDEIQYLLSAVLEENATAFTQEELQETLNHGKVPSRLEEELLDAKNQGIIQ